MTTVDIIRNNLIDKILLISNEEYLMALNNLISFSSTEDQLGNLTKEQTLMLEMSEDDIRNGRTISQDDLQKKTREWLENTSL
jgi:hypothetical protein